MKIWPTTFVAVVVAGCVSYQPKPVSPAENAAKLDARRLGDAGLRRFLEQNSRSPKSWPLQKWDLDSLTLAAFYFNPSLDVARAQWREAQAGIKTAAGRPNPTVTATPGYDFNASAGVNPWFPGLNLDVPVETAGKRGKRIAAAKASAESARFSLITIAWQVRSRVRDSLLDCVATERQIAQLKAKNAAQEKIAKLSEQRFESGEISRPELTAARIAANQARLDLSAAQSKLADARARLAQAVGVSAAAFDGQKLRFDFTPPAAKDLTAAAARRRALQGRADILGELADYAAAEKNLQLEIAKQYPDVHFSPNYTFDQGEDKWSLGLTVELPVLNQNQGPIREAKARRETAAARFNELQAEIIGEIDRAVESFHSAREQLKTSGAMFAAEQRQRQSAEAQFKAGASDCVDFLGAQIELATAVLAQLDREVKLQEAIGALEDALQSPLTLPDAVVHATQKNPREAKPISKHEP